MGAIELLHCERYGTGLMQSGCDKHREKHPERCEGCSGPVSLGEFTAVEPEKVLNKDKVCVHVDEDGTKCEELALAKGLCSKHYSRMKYAERKLKNNKIREKAIDSITDSIESSMKGSAKEMSQDKIKQEEIEVPEYRGGAELTAAPQKKTNNAIHSHGLSFYERDRDMLDSLVERAEENRRSVNQEILYILDRALAMELKGEIRW